jgi:hypothetical protein
MAFSITITMGEAPHRYRWDDGAVRADDFSLNLLKGTAAAYQEMGRQVGPFGMSLDPTDWDDGLAFLSMCIEANEADEIKTTGTLPEPPVPAGAVI